MAKFAIAAVIGLFLLSACSSKVNNNNQTQSTVMSNVVYGQDDRQEYYATRDELKVLADSTVAVIPSYILQENLDTGTFDAVFFGESIGDHFGFCKDERFYEQSSAFFDKGFCTGFLVAKDIVLTAGHCVLDTSDCQDIFFVFDYSMKDSSSSFASFPKSQVYKCKEMISRKSGSKGADYAIVRLEREVEDRAPLKLRSAGKLEDSDRLILIGHPSGLPTKISEGETIRDNNDNNVIFANTDSFYGDSGAPVLNAKTFEVEGILVRGENDYIFNDNDNCARVNRCLENSCRGEDITRITAIPDLDKLL